MKYISFWYIYSDHISAVGSWFSDLNECLYIYIPSFVSDCFIRLSEMGQHVGVRILDVMVLREKGFKREIKLLNMLLFIKANLWKVSTLLVKLMGGAGVSYYWRGLFLVPIVAVNPQKLLLDLKIIIVRPSQGILIEQS